jgi:hypothetical protein
MFYKINTSVLLYHYFLTAFIRSHLFSLKWSLALRKNLKRNVYEIPISLLLDLM